MNKAIDINSSEIWRKTVKLGRLIKVPDYRSGLRQGVAATVEHEVVPFDVRARTVIDVGAGRGQFALFAGHKFPAATIHSFEPLSQSFATARRALPPSGRIHLRQVAVGAARGEVSFHVTADSDSSSLLSPTSQQRTRFAGTDEVAEMTVEVMSLDELLPSIEPPALLKLDIQGAELDALKGAERVLGAVMEIFVECSFVELYEGQPLVEEVIEHLHGQGFMLSGVFSVTYGTDRECIQADLLFRRRTGG